jgi:hypothetical protein
MEGTGPYEPRCGDRGAFRAARRALDNREDGLLRHPDDRCSIMFRGWPRRLSNAA